MIQDLVIAQTKAGVLFDEALKRNYIIAGQSEKDVNNNLFNLAEELFGIKKYWHKRIVRAGANTLFPYKENPENLMLKADDIIFFDFGPVFEEWEADYGRTFVLGNDQLKLKLKKDIEDAWHVGKEYFDRHYEMLTGAAFYSFTKKLALKFGWEYGGPHCGHLIGNFPHEKIQGDEVVNYLHPNNHERVAASDQNGNKRHWIYEIHFINKSKQIGGFFEQLVSAADQ